MALEFEIGDPSRPRGHALVYFRDWRDPEQVSATYIVILPVSVDIAKYVPPFLAGQIESLSAGDMSAFSFPPAPEPVNSEAEVRSLAEQRGDDLIFGGAHRLEDAASLMGLVGSITADYRKLYDDHAKTVKVSGPGQEESLDEGPRAGPPGVDDLMYGLMDESELLNELTTLVGRLRYAIEGRDGATAQESETRIRSTGRYLPQNRRVDLLADAAAGRGPHADELARLYLDRAFGLYREDYRHVKTVEDRIRELTGGELSAGPDTGRGSTDPEDNP